MNGIFPYVTCDTLGLYFQSSAPHVVLDAGYIYAHLDVQWFVCEAVCLSVCVLVTRCRLGARLAWARGIMYYTGVHTGATW